MKVLFFTKYARIGASSRYRTFQYDTYMKDAGFKITISPLFSSDYLNRKYSGNRIKHINLLISVIRRVFLVISSAYYDFVVIEKELFPYCPAFLEMILIKMCPKYSIDMDDALFHIYDNHRNRIIRHLLRRKFESLLSGACLVTCGNPYVLSYAERFNKNSILIPTVVPKKKYNLFNTNYNQPIVVGWIGTPNTEKYLYLIHKALQKYFLKVPGILLLIGASQSFELEGVPIARLSWSENDEAALLANIDIGIMPLPNKPLERGKSGLKLIQYMAAGKPVVASPVGVNIDIVNPDVGMLAHSEIEWIKSLTMLASDPVRRREMGINAKKLVEDKYSLETWGPIYPKLIKKTVCSRWKYETSTLDS